MNKILKWRAAALTLWVGLCLSLLAIPLQGSAQAASFQPGVHYFELKQVQPVQTGDQVEVLELFWYGCPHCFDLEPYIEAWLQNKPEAAEYVRLPAIFRDSWALHARAYYTFEALGIVDQVHKDFFDEIHRRRSRIVSFDQLVNFAGRHGVDAKEFKDAFESFAVDSKLRHARNMTNRYEATGVPTIIVDGKYRATVSSAGGQQQLMELVNFLVAKAAEERS